MKRLLQRAAPGVLLAALLTSACGGDDHDSPTEAPAAADDGGARDPATDAGREGDAGRDGSVAAIAPDPLEPITVDLGTCLTTPTSTGPFTRLGGCSRVDDAVLLHLTAEWIFGVSAYRAGSPFDQPIITKLPKAGGAPTVLVAERTEDGGLIDALLVDDLHLFFIRQRTGRKPQLRMAPAAGGASTVVAEAAGLRGLAGDANAVYVARLDDVTGTADQRWSLVRIDKSSLVQTVLTSELREPVNLLVRDTKVIASSFGVGIVAVPTSGGAVELLVDAKTRLYKVTSASDGLWWVDRGAFTPSPASSTSTLWSLPSPGAGVATSVLTMRGQAGLPCVAGGAVHLVAGLPVSVSPAAENADAQDRLLRVASGSAVARSAPAVSYLGGAGEQIDVACDASGVYVGWRRAPLE